MIVKIEKPKIEEISSKEYEEGRIDRFLISQNKDVHRQIISSLVSLGVYEKNLEEFDFVTSNNEGYFFVHNRGIRVHMILHDNNINLILDSRIPKKKLMNEFKKHFQIF